jgi:hypothetical protein
MPKNDPSFQGKDRKEQFPKGRRLLMTETSKF